MCWWYFVKIPNQKCHENSFGRKSVVPCGQKDMMRLTVSLIILRLRLKMYQHPKACIRLSGPVLEGYGDHWWTFAPHKNWGIYQAGSTINWKKKNRNKRETQCFVTNLQEFCNIYEISPATCLCFLQLYRVPSPVDKDQNVCFVAIFTTWRSVSAQCGAFAVWWGHGFNNSKVEYGRDV